MNVLGNSPPLPPRPQRYVLPLLRVDEESPSAKTFRFSTRGTGFQYRSNQAIRLALPGVDDPWGAVRSFSLSSSPSEPDLLSVTCRISETPFKQALARLQPGDTAEVYGPLGMFLLDAARPCVFLAGGIGVTPFRGMLRYSSDTGQTAPRRLLYSARVPEELLFRSELDALTAGSPNLQVHYTVTRADDSRNVWNGHRGRIDEKWIRQLTSDLERPMFYIGGLPEMVDTMLALLRGPLGIPEDDIDYEVFRGF